MSKLHIAVLRGGPSNEYDISLNTGATILRNLPEKYTGHDIFISKSGIWHRDGIEKLPHQALAGISVVINGLHGEYGEDGKVQKILHDLSIPYTGSDALGSSLGMNKPMAKQILSEQGIKTPYFSVIKNTDDISEKKRYVFNHFFLPFVVKPVSSGSSLGVTVVKNFQHLSEALEKAFQYSDTALIEEYISGKEATCGIITDFRGEGLYSLLPVGIKYAQGQDHFDSKTKNSLDHDHDYPGNFNESEKQELQRLAKIVHKALSLRHYSRSDFMVNPRRGIYFLEVNTLPALTPESTFHNSLNAIGANLSEFLDHIIMLALSGF